MTSPDSEALAERLERAAEFTEADFDVCPAEDLRQAASLIRSQAEALRVAREGLSEIADGKVPPDQHGHYLAHRAAVKVAREALAQIGKMIGNRAPRHPENTSIFNHSEQ